MQVIFAAFLALALLLSILSVFSLDWVKLVDESVTIYHGLFEVCLYGNRESGVQLGFEDRCEIIVLNADYYVNTPAIMAIVAWGMAVMAFFFAIFLRLINFRKFGLAVMGFLNICTGITLMIASALMATLPLFEDDQVIFRRELSVLVVPDKELGRSFFQGWLAGLSFVCTGMLAIGLINRKSLKKRKRSRRPGNSGRSSLNS